MNDLIYLTIPLAVGLSIYYWSKWQITLQELDAARISIEYEKQYNKTIEELLVMYKDKIFSIGLKEEAIIKKAIKSLTPERLRTYLGYLIHSFGEHTVIDESFYQKHIGDQVPLPDELIKEYKENLIEILTHDDK